MQVVQHWIISECTILISLAMASQRPRILAFGDVRVWNTELVSELVLELVSELVTEFISAQTEMIKETVIEAITGTIMAMIAELTRDWIGD